MRCFLTPRLGDLPLWASIIVCAWSLVLGIHDAWGEASQEQASYLGAAIEVQGIVVDTNRRVEDTLGIRLSFRYRVGRVTSDKALHLVAYLASKRGQKVRTLVEDKAYRDRDGFIHGKEQLLTVPRNVWKQGTLFVPFYAMDLGEGRHALSLNLTALSDTGSCEAGRPPRAVKVIGQTSADIGLTKPPFKRVQILVRHVTVAEEPTDISLFRSRKGRPDLTWRLQFKAGREGVIHSSKVRDDTYDARWSQYTSEFPFSQGDRLTLSVLDEDVISHDSLGSIKLTLDQLLEQGSRSTPLKVGTSATVKLGQIKVR